MPHFSLLKSRPQPRIEVHRTFGLGGAAVCVIEERSFVAQWSSALCRQVERQAAFSLAAAYTCTDETRSFDGHWSAPICRQVDRVSTFALSPAYTCASVEPGAPVYSFAAQWSDARCVEIDRSLPVVGYSRHWGSSLDADSKTLHVELITRSVSTAGYFARVRFSNGLTPSVWVPAGAAGRKFTVQGSSHGNTGTGSVYSYKMTAFLEETDGYKLAEDAPKSMSVTFTMGIHPGGVGNPITT